MTDKRQGAAKNWAFTLNNYQESEYLDLVGAYPQLAKYLVIGKETGAEGTPHLQGYISFHKRVRLTSVKKLPGFERAHLEVARGTPSQNRTYCFKDGDAEEFGNLDDVGAGRRSDLDQIRDAIKADPKNAIEHVRENHYGSYIRYQKAIIADIQRCIPDRCEPPEVIVCWGPTGTGKSRWANEKYPGAYRKPHGSKWWNGYEQQEAVILDEFTGSWWPIQYMLTLCDRYPLQVETKGGFVKFTSKTIIICSNFSVEEWWPHVDERLIAALQRRITSRRHFNAELRSSEAKKITSVLGGPHVMM